MRNRPFWSGSLQLDIEGNTVLDQDVSPAVRNVVIGQYFEFLASIIFGAELLNPTETVADVPVPDAVVWGGHKGRDIILEVKASYCAPLMCSKQIDDFKGLEKNDFPFTRPRVFYVCFLHSATAIAEHCKTIRDLISYLSKSIDVCLVLPIDAIIKLASLNDVLTHDYGAWKSSRDSRKYVRWSKRLNKMLGLADKAALVDFLDLTTFRGSGKVDQFKEYTFRQQTVGGISIQRFRVEPFRVLSMYKRNDWRGSVREEHLRK